MFGFLALGLSLAAAPRHADADEGQVICTSVAHIWRGSGEDVRHIRDVPVPQSFREPFTGGGCARYQLVVTSLIDWHLAFGDEATTTAALAFIEAEHRAGAPAPSDFGPLLARAWRAAERDLRAAAPLIEEPRRDWTGFSAALDRSRPVARLRELVGVHERYVFLAANYLRAAEFYGSRALLEKARVYLAPAIAGERILFAAPGADGYPGQEIRNALALFDMYEAQARDTEIRLPIFEARLSRDPADIDAAQQALDRAYSPLLLRAAENAYEYGDGFCDVGDRTDLNDIAAACHDENDFQGRVTAFWRDQAALELLMAADPRHYRAEPNHSETSAASFARRAPGEADEAGEAGWRWPQLRGFDQAIRLTQLGRQEMIPESARRYDAADDALVALRLARADTFARLAPTRRTGAGGQADYDAASLESAALYDLAYAAQLAQPAEMPGRFRQAATAYLAIVAAAPARGDAQAGREAAYLRRTLADLDRIALGE